VDYSLIEKNSKGSTVEIEHILYDNLFHRKRIYEYPVSILDKSSQSFVEDSNPLYLKTALIVFPDFVIPPFFVKEPVFGFPKYS
jgi:hypothetical protein